MQTGSSVRYRRYLGDAAILTRTVSLTDTYPVIQFLHLDYVGSSSNSPSSSGSSTEEKGFSTL